MPNYFLGQHQHDVAKIHPKIVKYTLDIIGLLLDLPTTQDSSG